MVAAGVVAGLVAALLVVAFRAAARVGRESGTPPAAVPPERPDRREGEAASLFGRARAATAAGQWASARAEIESLRRGYDDTSFYAARRREIDGLWLQVELGSLREQALALAEQGKFGEAMELLAAFRRMRDSPDAAGELARLADEILARARRRYEALVREAEAAVARGDPKAAEAALGRVRAWGLAELWAEARRRLAELTAPPPKPPGDFALDLDGRASHVEVPDHPALHLDRFTAEAWVWRRPGGDAAKLVFGKDYGLGRSESFGIYLHRGLWRLVAADERRCEVRTTLESCPFGKWTHCALVVDKGDGALFVDGNCIRKGRVPAPLAYDGRALRIGADLDDGALGAFWNGGIDEVRISAVVRYREAFTPQRRFEPDADTVLLLHFDEGKGEIARDASRTGNHGLIHGARFVRPGKLQGMPPAVARPDPGLERALDAWPVVFEDRLDAKACLGRALLCKGQYYGHFDIRDALVVFGVHTHSAVWWNRAVGESFALSVDLKVTGGCPIVWLCGPGYGVSTTLAYTLRLPDENDELQVVLERDGRPLGVPAAKVGFERATWYRLDILKEEHTLSVCLDGRKLGEWHDPVPLGGPVHSFVGLGSIGGIRGDDGVWYRSLAIRMPQAEAERLEAQPVERVLDPPPTTPVGPNGKLLALDDFAADGLSRWVATQRADAARKGRGGLVLSGPNAWPRLWRKEPLTGSFAVEYDMSYFPRGEALNFFARLRLGNFVDPKTESFQGWSLGFPGGNGVIQLQWRDARGAAHDVAAASYFAPTTGRPYVLRLEKDGSRLRVFSNGSFLLEGRAPVGIAAAAPVYMGLFQIYGGSLVKRMAVWEIAARPDDRPPPNLPEHAADFGPRLAAAASFFAAFDQRVRPLLARRDYAAAAGSLRRLGLQPEFGLAADQVELRRKDLGRLAALWARVQRRAAAVELARMKAADVLALLGPGFPNGEESRLQAALFLLFDRDADPERAIALLDKLPAHPDARRCRALAALKRRAGKAPHAR